MDWFCWVWEKQCNIEGSAAWFQAVMSVGAIIYASWVSRAADRKSYKETVHLTVAYLLAIQRDLKALSDACDDLNLQRYSLILTSLENEIEMFKNIKMQDFKFTVIYSLRNINTEAGLILNMLRIEQVYSPAFHEHRKRINNALQTIEKASDRVIDEIGVEKNFQL